MANIQKSGEATLGSMLAARVEKIAKHLDGAINTDKFMSAAMMCVRKDRNLANCSPESFYAAVEAAAQVQLFPGPTLGHAYLVPYKKECTFILGYKGMVALIQRCGAKKAVARCVYENDEFNFEYGSDERIHHKPALKSRGEFIGAYAIIFLKNGEQQIEYMDVEEINKVRDGSASRNGPWKTNYDEMARKTPLRRAFKWMPVDPGFEHLVEAATLDEYEDAGIPRDVEAEVVQGAAPTDLEGLAEELTAEPEVEVEVEVVEPEPEPKKKAAPKKAKPKPEPLEVEVVREDQPLPVIPWDDSDELGGYPIDVRDEAASMAGWIGETVAIFGGSSWRALCNIGADDPYQIKLAKLVQGGVMQVRKSGVVEPLAARAAIVAAILDAKEGQG